MIGWILSALWVLGGVSFTFANLDLIMERLRKAPPSPTFRLALFFVIVAVNLVLWLPLLLAGLMRRLWT